MNAKIDISEYVQECTKCCIDEACSNQNIPAILFQQARQYYDVSVSQLC